MAALIWASSFIALKYTFRTYDPMVVIFGRMFVASVCFLLLWKYIRQPKIYREDIKYLLLMSFCEPCLYFLFEAAAVKNTTASGAGVITALLPLMVAVGARRFLKEEITKYMVAGFAVAIIGSIWLSLCSASSAYAPHPVFGNFMEFLAMVCASGYFIVFKHLSGRYGSFFLTATQAFVGAVFYLPLLLLPSIHIPRSFEPAPALAVIYLGVVVTLGAYGLYNYGASRTKASTASAFINLIPAFTILLAFILLGEKLNAGQMAAVLVVFAGVFISQIKPKVSGRDSLKGESDSTGELLA